MDRNLANYLFHNETLYVVSEETMAGVHPKEEQATWKEISSSEKDQKPSESGDTQVTDQKSSPKANTNFAVKEPDEVIKVYPMKTKHLVVVKNLQTAERDLLEKIMAAIKLKMDIVDLVDVKEHPSLDFKETIYGNMPEAILFFGPESGEEFLVKLKLEKYSPKVLKGINFLMADNLGTILNNQDNEKMKLWDCLKAIFKV